MNVRPVSPWRDWRNGQRQERWILVAPEGGHGDWAIHTEDGGIVAQGMSEGTAGEIAWLHGENQLLVHKVSQTLDAKDSRVPQLTRDNEELKRQVNALNRRLARYEDEEPDEDEE